MTKKLFAGIDVGTTTTKAVIIDTEKNVLGRYTHRIAIANRRLIDLTNEGKVRFRWKDYADGGKQKTASLEAHEFIRRFLQHVVPSGFMRIRYYGFLANRHRADRLARCRELLGVASAPPWVADETLASEPSTEANDPWYVCPRCHAGRMVVVERFEPNQQQMVQRIAVMDTS